MAKMYGLYDKKNLNLIILKILWEHTDEDHRLQQQEIVSLLKTQYGIEIDRRTVKNNVEALKSLLYDTNYEISTEKGYCLIGREFTDAELRMLIDSVLFSKNISQKQAKDLIRKIKGLSSKYFSAKVNHIYHLPELPHADQKQQVLYNLDIIHDAISEKRKISFIYNTYGTDFKLHPKRKNVDIVNPYYMLAHNGHYYLICNFDKYSDVAHLRIDKMTDVKILEETAKKQELFPELQKGLNLPRYLSEHVYMYSGKSIPVVFRCNETLLDDMHKEKIRMADSIFVVNPNGYIGNSTWSEICYAKMLHKEIQFMCPIETDLIDSMVNRHIREAERLAWQQLDGIRHTYGDSVEGYVYFKHKRKIILDPWISLEARYGGSPWADHEDPEQAVNPFECYGCEKVAWFVEEILMKYGRLVNEL